MIEIILEAERALTTGQLDQAERLYRQAAELDPRNSIAVVGLARVALDRGDERAAYTLARRALEIDPENAAGRRLAERLEEVMRYRGEQPPAVAAPPPVEAKPAPPAPAPATPPRPTGPPRRKRRSLLDRIRRRR
ncbi:MAG TPA: tetratricopeptide repeat protein [Candidatus Limnocylindrales bacterium]|nr:tetratricopeptide repeat protein [Candidatus Limnocylindrales bacterium]